ncbi:MAG: hypothetical protein IJ494_00800, partial [Bacteroides sp.]|nr:hypothetical protein [Bacteroides sp.]
LLTGTFVAQLGENQGSPIYSAFYYDNRKRLIQTQATNHLSGGYEKEYLAYNFIGDVVKRLHVHNATGKATQTETYRYLYDNWGRLLTVMHKLNDGTEILLAGHTYDAVGRLQSKLLHTNVGTDITKLTYTYNIRDWLTGISNANFSQTLNYDNYYNGNISGMNWTAGGENHAYTFSYDNLNRLTDAVHGNNHYTEKVTSYDKNGNIKALQRYGQLTSSTYGLVDNLTFTLNGNQVVKVEDAVTSTSYTGGTNFLNGSTAVTEYAYDENGSLIKDLNKNITNISYNLLSLPSVVTFGDGSTITYTYAADGKKLRTVHMINGVTTTTDYCGNVIYENDVPKTLLTETGYISLMDSKYHYYIKDHLGNNRVVADSEGNVEEVNQYYPFGGLFTTNSSIQPYKYNGKELNSKAGLNWYDYGARHYDAALGRFTTFDPLADYTYYVSPFAYCGDNPIIRVDKDGRIGDTVWDILNVVYDVGAAVYNHITGNHEQAKSHWQDAGADAFAAAVPFVPAGTTKVLRAADKVADVVKTTDKVGDTKKATSATKYRVKLRKDTKEAIKENAEKTADGHYIDPNTRRPIEPGQEVFGHKTGHEWGKYKSDIRNQNKTRKEVIEDQNDPNIYHIEDKLSNASHKYEENWKREKEKIYGY